jgi:hypothetical protein
MILVVAFRGDRSHGFAGAFLSALADERSGRGPGPTLLDCLLYAGHTGVSTDEGRTVYGFHPDSGGKPVWQLMDGLKQGDGFPGVVKDDTIVFATARARGLPLWSFEVIFPDPRFQAFQATLDAERSTSQYSYGFPNGDGDCNCTTWLERMGLPLLTGRMNEFAGLWGISAYPSRRFGRCT